MAAIVVRCFHNMGVDMFGAMLGQFGAEMIGRRHQWMFDKKAIEMNEAFQRELAQNAIRYKVEDARRAGVHPLFALGTQPTQGSFLGGATGSSGSAVGSVIAQRQAAAESSRLVDAQIDNMSAQAQYYRSLAARTDAGVVQPRVSFASGVEGASAPYRSVGDIPTVQLDPGPHGDYSRSAPGAYDLIRHKPAEIESANPSAEWSVAGPGRPGFQPFRLTSKLEMLLPVNEEGWSEGVESIPYWMYPMVYQANRDRYGPDFWRVFVQEFGAQNPLARWISRLGHESPLPGDTRGQWKPIRR